MKSRNKIKGKIFLVVLFLLVVGGYLFFREGTLPVDKSNKTSEIFVVRPGDGINAIINNLREHRFIRNRVVFFAIVYQLGIGKKIQAGDFRLSKSMDAYSIAKSLTHGTLDVWITIPEGWRKEEIAERIGKNLDIPEIQFIQKAPEGYLFPDTYLFPKDANADTVISIMTNTFDKRLTPQIDEKRRSLSLTKNQFITLASIVEKEARYDEDRPTAASVFLRRWRSGIPLQSDVTVQYALGYQPSEKHWWKTTELTADDLNINSPYNTRKFGGLPPGPICNPGLASLEAVANADENTPYLYFYADKKGRLHFAKSLEDHQRNIDKYGH